MKTYLTFLFFILINLQAFAQTKQEIKVEVISKDTTSWDGNILSSYPIGKPEITISKITIPAGFDIPIHKHVTPLAAVILEGELTVTKENGEQKVFRIGESVIEVLNVWHSGKNSGEVPTVLLAFYIGEVGTPLSINQ